MQIRICENQCVLSIQTKYKIKFGPVRARICACSSCACRLPRAILLHAPAVVCSHVSVPFALVAMFHSHEVLMKPLPLYITNSLGLLGNLSR